ncbi:MAG: alpha-L-fucosidase, partial [Luteolibacter sp.]
RKGYKSAASIVRMLADIVSRNGNLMLSVPLRRDGQPDEQEIEIVKEIGSWLKVNGEAIYATRPWKIYGEGPSTAFSEKGSHDGQADVSKKPFTPEDIRYTTSKDGRTLYAIVCSRPTGPVALKSLGKTGAWLDRPIAKIEQLGATESIVWSLGPDALTVTPSFARPVSDAAVAFKITLQ